MKILRFLLFPFAIIYGLITSIRNLCYDLGIFKSTGFNTPTIVVGNLSVGGTGKSPQIEYLIRLLKDNYKIATLSRGYKRKTKGFLLINDKHTAEDSGDEPMQFYKKFKNDIKVAVDADRTNGITKLLEQESIPEVILLDDAFQHRKVKAGFYVLLTKYTDLYVNDFIVPAGNLRESRSGAKRADIVVVTKCPDNLSIKEQQKIIAKIKPSRRQKVFFSTICYNTNLPGTSDLTIAGLQTAEILLVTGIANANPLLNYLAEKRINYQHLNFPDHHDFTEGDLKKIQNKFDKINAKKKYIVTTEKDYVRLEGKFSQLNYIEIHNKILNDQEEFNSSILNYIKSN